MGTDAIMRPEVLRAVDALVGLAVDGQVSERDVDRVVSRLQLPAIAYRDVLVELQERNVDLIHEDDLAGPRESDSSSPRRTAGGGGGHGGFGHFMRTAGGHRVLTAEEERALAIRIQNGQRAAEMLTEHGDALDERKIQVLHTRVEDGSAAKKELMRHNVRLAVHVAKRFTPQVRRLSLEFEDVVQEAIIGLNRAAEKFDPTRGLKFSTYATWWVRQSIQRAIANQGHLIRLPIHIQDLVWKLTKYLHECERRQQSVDLDVAASRLGTTRERTEDLLILATGGGVGAVRSLDIPIGDEGDAALADFLEDEEAVDPQVEVLEGEKARVLLDTMADKLTDRERAVLELRFGFRDDHPRTLEEIGQEFGLTRERIRQIQNNAFKTLRQPEVARLLMAA